MGQLTSDITDILNQKDSKSSVRSQRQEILRRMATDEQTKTNLIKKALATQRAKYGAGGMSGRGMTEEAVLKRIAAETAEPYNEKRDANISKLKTSKTTKKKNLVSTLLKRFDEMMG